MVSMGRTSITLGARDRIVRRAPNARELNNNFGEYLTFGPTDADNIIEWAEAIEGGSSDVYPLERVETMRLHVHRRGADQTVESIWFRQPDDADAFVIAFPQFAEQLVERRVRATNAAKWHKVRDVESRVEEARADEKADSRFSRLVGSDKQVAWAGDIRREYVASGGSDPVTLRMSAAKSWIDQRGSL